MKKFITLKGIFRCVGNDEKATGNILCLQHQFLLFSHRLSPAPPGVFGRRLHGLLSTCRGIRTADLPTTINGAKS